MKKFLILILISIAGTMFPTDLFSQVLEGPPRDGVYDKTAISQLEPIAYPYLREADIIWTRRIWRVIDMREKMNQPFYYPLVPQNNWKSLMTIIWDGLREGTIVAYSAEVDQFLTPITFNEVKDRIEIPDTMFVPDPDNPEQKIMKVIKMDFSSENVKKFRIKEDFYFDRQRSVMEVRILGLCPVMEKIDPKSGESRGDMPLFWVYFPECRGLFARNEMFNLRNGSAGRLTYDDVFMKRIFSSYIYKEENVYDRQINEYSMNVDALIEAERAKNSLFEFEHDLWQY